MEPREKAKELIERFSPVVYPFLGSSMLTNEPNYTVILNNAKICANITIDEILNLDTGDTINKDYWEEVRKSIENYKNDN